MTCTKAIDRYLALDKHEPVPFKLTVHLLRCKNCRSMVRAMTQASYLCSISIDSSLLKNEALFEKTMNKINATKLDLIKIQAKKYSLPEVRIFPWIVIGLILIVGLGSIPLTSMGRWAVYHFNLSFLIPFAIVFASLVSTYTAIFVGRNLDFFVKKFELKN